MPWPETVNLKMTPMGIVMDQGIQEMHPRLNIPILEKIRLRA
jgi:hypothetical protein